MKFDSVDFHNYTEWQRYILRSHPVIPKDCRRATLIAFCFALAFHGSAGMDCYASDSLLGKELGINRKYLKKYRRLVVELGWFTPGRKVNRVESLNIAIPLVQRDVPKLAEDSQPTELETAKKLADVERTDREFVDPWADDAKSADPWSDMPAA